MTDESSPYLAPSAVIDWQHPAVSALADQLRSPSSGVTETTRRCFEWVRDNIDHTSDFSRDEVTCSASEVLQAGTGFCYAKSHLLAGLLRACGIPAGLCYQRLSIDGKGAPFCLHGLNAVLLPDVGWYRIDARGDRDDIRTAVAPPHEQLAFSVTLSGEFDFPEIWPDPASIVVRALSTARTATELTAQLPDVSVVPSTD